MGTLFSVIGIFERGGISPMDTTASGMETCSHFQSKQEDQALPKGGESPPEPPRVFWPARRWPPGEASPWEGAAEVCLMLLDLVFCGASW